MSAGRWFVVALVFLAVLIGFWGFGFAMKWWGAATEVVSPANVQEQHRMVLRDWEGLYASAENACIVQTEADENSPTFVEKPETAYAANFRRIVADYNGRMANIFEAQIAGPPGYPEEIPRSLGSDGDWCSVPIALDALRD